MGSKYKNKIKCQVAVKQEKVGKTGAKRIRNITGRPFKAQISKPGLRRLCRRAGSTRVAHTCYDIPTTMIVDWVKNIVKKCCIYTEHSGRKTVIVLDAIYALRRSGLNLYGYGSN